MPRKPRALAVGYPHHVTQRGNDRRIVFTDEEDYALYLKWLSRYARQYGLDIWAYCLMPNHIHVVAVPQSPLALSRTFNLVHMQYAQHINAKTHSSGHVWQGRYFSCVLDESHLYAAVRYVEMNPVRAKLVAAAQDYLWSSARCHLSGQPNHVISGHCFLTEEVMDWGRFLADASDPALQDALIKATASGQPCGSDAFKQQMEGLLGQRFIRRPVGRPRGKKGGDGREEQGK